MFLSLRLRGVAQAADKCRLAAATLELQASDARRAITIDTILTFVPQAVDPQVVHMATSCDASRPAVVQGSSALSRNRHIDIRRRHAATK
jgi:hypothetical protein